MPPTTMRATHSNGTIAASNVPLKVTTKKGRGFGVRLQVAADSEVSFDSGRTWYPLLAANGEFRLEVAFHFFYLRSSAGGAYQALITEG
jgi:hypothetical protein